MNARVLDYYNINKEVDGIKDPFYKFIMIDNTIDISWEKIQEMAPAFPRSWFELCNLKSANRVEFIYEFWKSSLPYVPQFSKFLNDFFSKVDDIAVFLVKNFPKDPYKIEMVYSLNNNSFFRGGIGANEKLIKNLNLNFENILPNDYLSFLKIHNGFSKSTDNGLIPTFEIDKYFKKIQEIIINSQHRLACGDKDNIEPSSIIPFYQSFHRKSYQCFCVEWQPKGNIGNIYYSVDSSHVNKSSDLLGYLSFNTFLDWMMFYLEDIKL